MEIQLSEHEWLKLPMDTRDKLRQIFNIPKSKGVVLEDNTVKSDGTTYQDLQAITVDKMQEYLGSDLQDFAPLFNEVIAKIDDEKEVAIAEDLPDPKQLMVDEWIAVLNRIKGQAVEKQMEDYLQATINRLFEINKVDFTKRTNEFTNVASANPPKRRGRPKKA